MVFDAINRNVRNIDCSEKSKKKRRQTIRTQVYAVVHNGNYDFIIARKNIRSYFFHSDGGKIFPNGVKPNNSNNWALPGGQLENNTTPEVGARKEFLEETNVDLNDYHPIITNHQGPVENGWTYYGVYFNVGNQLNDLFEKVTRNLNDASDAATLVREGNITTYQQIHQWYPNSPVDNELAFVLIWSTNNDNDWTTIQTWENDNNLGWYYDILRNLRQN